MTTVQKVAPLSKVRCSQLIRVASGMTPEKGRQISRARRDGRKPTECGQLASHLIDKRPLCRHHAGAEALRLLGLLSG